MADSSFPLLASHNRSAAPCLSPDHLRLAQSTSQSTVTSVSSQFLSPPISNPPTGSPPPRLEADDYVGARAKRSKGKYQARTGHRLANKMAPLEDVSIANKIQSSGSSSPVETRNSVPGRSTSGGIFEGDVKIAPEKRQLSFPLSSSLHSSVQHPTLLRINTQMNTENESRSEFETNSPATESLRRLSMVGSTHERNAFRRLSENLASSLGMARWQVPHSLAPSSRTANQPSPNSPASITLRKASEAPQFVRRSSGAGLSYEVEVTPHNVEPRTTFSELISFRTTILPPQADLSPARNSQSGRTRSSTLTFSSSSGKVTPKALIQSDETSSKHSTPTANTALTFTDTHVAPGTFVVDPEAQSISSNANSPSRRLSLVQIRSKDSVHEIIWSEGDSRSDSGSLPSKQSIAPTDQDRSQDLQANTVSCKAGPSKPPNEANIPNEGYSLTTRRARTLSSLDQTLLQWVWQERSHTLAQDQLSESQRAPDSTLTDQAPSINYKSSVIPSQWPPIERRGSNSTVSEDVHAGGKTDSGEGNKQGAL